MKTQQISRYKVLFVKIKVLFCFVVCLFVCLFFIQKMFAGSNFCDSAFFPFTICKDKFGSEESCCTNVSPPKFTP